MTIPISIPTRIVDALRQRAGPQTSREPLTGTSAVHDTLARAAVLGAFEPRALLVGTEAERERVERLLADVSHEVDSARGRRWMVGSGTRQRVLAELVKAGTVESTIDAVEGIDTDPFGRLLQRALRGDSIRAASLPTDQLKQYFAIRRLLEPVPGAADSGESLAIEAELTRRSLDAAIDSVIPQGLIGRESELARLNEFASRAMPSGKTLGNTPALLLVTGVGGAGKSALVAAFARGLRDRKRSTSVVILDFDRPTISASDPSGLSLELLRQIAAWTRSADLQRLYQRFAVEAADATASVTQGEQGASRLRAQGSLLHEMGEILRRSPAPQRIVVILDTVEELAVAGKQAANALREWILLVGQYLTMSVPVILAGRLSAEAFQDAFDWSLSEQPVELGPLEQADAVRLLIALQMPRIEAKYFAERFDGNPLLLRLLADYRKANRDEPLESFSPAGKRRRHSVEVQLTYVYRRILGHIRDDRLRKLAHPGLVLRRVTPELIRSVLAKACGLGTLDDVGAKDLFDRLANHVWLVERRGDELIHRRDLRRLMLPLVSTDFATATRSIHRRASIFYGRTASTDDSAKAESLYHRLLAGKPLPQLTKGFAETVVAKLGGDLDDLPIKTRARIKAKAGSGLGANELAALPLREKIPRVELIMRTLMQESDPNSAANFAAEVLGSKWAKYVAADLAARALHRTGALEALSELRGVQATNSDDPAAEPVWLVNVARLLQQAKPKSGKARDQRLATMGRIRDGRNATRPEPWETAVAIAGLRGWRQGLATFTVRAPTTRRPPATVIALRQWMLTGVPVTRPIRLSALPLLQPRLSRLLRGTSVWSRPSEPVGRAGGTLLPTSGETFVLQAVEWRNLNRGGGLTLRAIDEGLKHWHSADVQLAAGEDSIAPGESSAFPREKLGRLIRGINPEFVAPAIAALGGVVTVTGGPAKLARLIWKLLPVRPSELAPKHLTRGLQGSTFFWLGIAVDLIDRGGRLGDLLVGARKIAPADPRLRTVTIMFRRWDRFLWNAWSKNR